MNFIKKIKYQMGKKKRELFVSRVSEVMTGLYVQLAEVVETELIKFREEADCFYSSQKKRQTSDFGEVRLKSSERLNKKIREVGEKYLRSAGNDAEEAFQKANEFLRKDSYFSATSFYSTVLWGFLESSDLSREEKMNINIGREERDTLDNLKKQWNSVEENARKKHLKPIMKEHLKPVRILHGTYGECTDCIGYDEEFKVYLIFHPDDNYRHWSGYDIYVIKKSKAERYANQKFDFPETDINISNEILHYYSSIESRII